MTCIEKAYAFDTETCTPVDKIAYSYQELSCALTLDVLILTRNSEATILSCIDSVIGVADKVIILDTGSSDSTLDIVRGLNLDKILVISDSWEGDFSYSRNLMLEYSNSDWVFYLDSDEMLLTENHETIRAKLKIFDSINTFLPVLVKPKLVNVKSSYKHISSRIFRNSNTSRWYGIIHEDVYPLNGEALIIESTIGISHSGYDLELTRKRKDKRNFKLVNKMKVLEPENSKWDFYNAVDSEGIIPYDKTIELMFEYIKTNQHMSTRCITQKKRVSYLCYSIFRVLFENEVDTNVDLNEVLIIFNNSDPDCIDRLYIESLINISEYSNFSREMISKINRALGSTATSYIDGDFEHMLIIK